MFRRLANQPRTVTVVRAVSAAVALVSAAVLTVQVLPGSASAAAPTGTTVAWTGDTGTAAADQPARSTSSPHYSRMKNISVTVDQTDDLLDQAVRVHVSGFSPTRSFPDYMGYLPANAANFVQAMQCWGDPASPTFAQTCQWGGNYGSNAGIGSLVESDTLLRVASTNLAAPPEGTDIATDPADVPFLSVDGNLISGRQQTVSNGGQSTTSYPLFSMVTPSTTNEVPGARIDADGTGTFDFETQNSDTAPQLGCGTTGHLRCWLVIVPRDDVWGGGKPGSTGTCSAMLDSGFQSPAYGSTGVPQAGSPVNPACDYWDNRIVVPLDFTPTGVTCPAGSPERRTVGSDLLVSAMASWQPELCKDAKTNYSFDTNPDPLSRSQLVQGTVDLAFTPGPVVASELSDNDAETLKTTAISYAPVAATSAVVGFFADGRNGRINDLHLSPRLVAKLLTQSYPFTVPIESTNPQGDIAHLPAVNRSYTYWSSDPDFQALNPNWADFVSNPSVLLPGPYSDDVIAQLWKWIVADPDARAFLNGAADPWGMTVNPYYRAAGDPLAVVPTFDDKGEPITSNGKAVTKAVGLTNLDGSPLKLGDSPLTSFIKADATLVPLDASSVRYPFGSIQSSPYSQDFLSGTRATFHANPGAKVQWDPNAIDAAGEVGAWVSSGPQVVGQRFTLAFTDAPSAALYDLSEASLSLPGQPSVFTQPTDEQVTAALTSSAMAPTSVAAVSAFDPAKAQAGQYPLTSLVYAAVNLGSASKESRADYAAMIRQVTTSGQTPGAAIGQLPAGYVPLISAQVSQAAASATAIESYVAPASSDAGSGTDSGDLGGYAMDGDGTYGYPSSGEGSGSGGGSSATGAASPTTVTAEKPAYAGRTVSTTTAWPLQWFLLASLAAGVLGALLSPLLFRRRRLS